MPKTVQQGTPPLEVAHRTNVAPIQSARSGTLGPQSPIRALTITTGVHAEKEIGRSRR